jgi:hypothetical protein
LNLHHDKSALLGYIMAHNHGIPKPIVEYMFFSSQMTIWSKSSRLGLEAGGGRPPSDHLGYLEKHLCYTNRSHD